MRFTPEEWYPVYMPDEPWCSHTGAEVPEPLASRQEQLLAELGRNNAAIAAYLRAVRRDEESYKQVTGPLLRQLERGRRRPYRRAHPERR